MGWDDEDGNWESVLSGGSDRKQHELVELEGLSSGLDAGNTPNRPHTIRKPYYRGGPDDPSATGGDDFDLRAADEPDPDPYSALNGVYVQNKNELKRSTFEYFKGVGSSAKRGIGKTPTQELYDLEINRVSQTLDKHDKDMMDFYTERLLAKAEARKLRVLCPDNEKPSYETVMLEPSEPLPVVGDRMTFARKERTVRLARVEPGLVRVLLT